MKSAILALATVFLASAQQPAPLTSSLFPSSDGLNKELPRWLRFSGEYRTRAEGFTSGGYRGGNDDAWLLSRLRINMKIQPVSWLKFQFQGQDARVFWKNQNPAAPPSQNTMDLRLAYMEIGDPEKGTVALRAGRQELLFGEQRLVGNVNWLNTARSFDAVRLTLRHRGYRVDAFASSVVQPFDGEFDRPFRTKADNFHGLYGGIEKLVPKAVIEPYLFWRVTRDLPTETGTRGNRDFKTVGVRWVGKLPLSFDYGTEMATQTGSLGPDDIAAWAGHWVLGYALPAKQFPMRLFAEYNYASGDKNPRDGKRGTFDQLYPTGHDKIGLADQVGWRNIHDLRGGIEMRPRGKWSITPSYHSFWLASATDALYAANGLAVARVADGSAGRRVGQEVDIATMYTLNKQVQVGAGFAHLFPGRFLKKATPGQGYSSPYVMLIYGF
jgi:hypothetical protein